jgi:NAD(P)-dependent dehydrogenase (short-subunit alcohol dehydrogenase family)
MSKPLAVVTGASSGIGLELAAICAQEGFDLLVAADRPEIHTAAERFRGLGAQVTVVETDLATTDGVDQLWSAAAGQPVDALLANAGHGLGRGFLDQDFEEVRHVIDTNVTGTVYLVQWSVGPCAAGDRDASCLRVRSRASCPVRIKPFTTGPRPSSIRSRLRCGLS